MNLKKKLKNLNIKELQELLILKEELRLRQIQDSPLEFAKQIFIPSVPVNDLEDCDKFYADKITPAKHPEIILNTVGDLIKGKLLDENKKPILHDYSVNSLYLIKEESDQDFLSNYYKELLHG